MTYTGKRGGIVDITLLAINDTPIGNLPTNLRPRLVDDDKLRWDDFVPGLDMFIQLRPTSIEIFKVVKSASAPRSLTWRIVDTPSSPVSVQQASRAIDHAGDPDLTVRREARMLTTITPEASPAPGRRAYTYREEFTGETLVENPVTRVKEVRPSAETVYPVRIDVQVLEDITTNNDDGNDHTTYNWRDTTYVTAWSLNDRRPGFRFQSVAVPQGATIDDPTEITFKVISADGNIPTGTLFYGYDTDSAAAFSSTVHPAVLAVTTATATIGSSLTSTGTKTLSIKSIVQEIVNRGGWASGNHMAFFTASITAGVAGIDALNYHPATSADLEINYTAGGGTFPQPKLFLLLGVGG